MGVSLLETRVHEYCGLLRLGSGRPAAREMTVQLYEEWVAMSLRWAEEL